MTIPDSDTVYIILALGGFFIVGIIGKRAGWFKIVSGTNQLLREQNIELRQQNEYLKDQLKSTHTQHEQDKLDWDNRHTESMREIAKLQGKVETLTALPLKEVNKTLQEMITITKQSADSNTAILEQLQQSAHIAAEDRDVLTNQNLHIKTEVNKVIEKNK